MHDISMLDTGREVRGQRPLRSRGRVLVDAASAIDQRQLFVAGR